MCNKIINVPTPGQILIKIMFFNSVSAQIRKIFNWNEYNPLFIYLALVLFFSCGKDNKEPLRMFAQNGDTGFKDSKLLQISQSNHLNFDDRITGKKKYNKYDKVIFGCGQKFHDCKNKYHNHVGYYTIDPNEKIFPDEKGLIQDADEILPNNQSSEIILEGLWDILVTANIIKKLHRKLKKGGKLKFGLLYRYINDIEKKSYGPMYWQDQYRPIRVIDILSEFPWADIGHLNLGAPYDLSNINPYKASLNSCVHKCQFNKFICCLSCFCCCGIFQCRDCYITKNKYIKAMEPFKLANRNFDIMQKKLTKEELENKSLKILKYELKKIGFKFGSIKITNLNRRQLVFEKI